MHHARPPIGRRSAAPTRAFKTRNATQLVFSAIGLGTAPLGELYEVLDEQTSIATVEQALASGVRIRSSTTATSGRMAPRLGAAMDGAYRALDKLRSDKTEAQLGRLIVLSDTPPSTTIVAPTT